jgi:creatinine amidohydrolase/Fe(II)-dependent formamide hydrolase-like protein
VIVDCARRMAAWGIQRLVVLSAHGGNGRALALAETRLRQELPALAVWIPDAMTICGDAVLAVAQTATVCRSPRSDLHAGEWETSELLRLHPEQVRMDQAAPGYTGDMDAALATLVANGNAGADGDRRGGRSPLGERGSGRALSGGASRVLCRRRGKQWLIQTEPN